MICPHCYQDVEGTWVDEGIGQYEYWGQVCIDKQMVFICEECEGLLEPQQSHQDYVSEMGNHWKYDKYD